MRDQIDAAKVRAVQRRLDAIEAEAKALPSNKGRLLLSIVRDLRCMLEDDTQMTHEEVRALVDRLSKGWMDDETP